MSNIRRHSNVLLSNAWPLLLGKFPNKRRLLSVSSLTKPLPIAYIRVSETKNSSICGEFGIASFYCNIFDIDVFIFLFMERENSRGP